MPPFGYIGIDFGTSNTHFAHCATDSDPPKAETIRLGDCDAQTTCVLWKVPKEKLAYEADLVEDYGTMALHTWLEHQIDGRMGGHFGFGFKPDLPNSEQARLDAWAYLHKACLEIRTAGLPRAISPSGYAVVVGVPAEVGAEHRRLTAEIAARAGFGDVECVEEPLGALAYHLSLNHITSAEARAGIVVVDFGGGTLDVALVSAEGLHEPWGDPTLGGRLFDDLFYQWVAEQNKLVDVDQREALMVWQKECRRLKEDFSTRWRRKGDDLADFKGSIRVGGADKLLRNASVSEFEQRAKVYRPSLIVRKYFAGLDRVPNGLVFNEPVNLFDRIRQTLTRGNQVGLLRGRFSKIILTGGSSHWPFMRRLVAEAFGVDPDKDILMSQSPETTIGSGLALYNVLRLRNDTRRRNIATHKPQAKEEFARATEERIGRYAEDLSKSLLDVVVPRVEKVYWDWYANGGSLNQVEERVTTICADFEKNDTKEIVERHWKPLNVDLVRLMRDHLAKFLQENELPKDAAHYIPETVATIQDLQSGASKASDKIVDNLGDLASMASMVTMSVLLVIAAIKLKIVGVIVLATLHNPLLAASLGLGVILAAGVAHQSVKETVENVIKRHEFNWFTLKALKVAVWESSLRNKLAEGAAETRARLRQDIFARASKEDESAAKPELLPGELREKPLAVQAVATFDRLIDAAIKDLGVLDPSRPSPSV